jgi:glycosyltransferase involved in cell wall biosynthesis
VADFRDPWNLYAEGKGFFSGVNRKLESLVLKKADRIICINEKLKDDILRKHRNINDNKIAVISNGYDPEDFKDLKISASKKFTVTYCGIFNPFRKPVSFLEAVKKWIDEDASRKDKIQINFVGVLTVETLNVIERLGLKDIIYHPGYVPHREALEYMAGASCLLLVIDEVEQTACIQTSKLFEYLRTGKPILAVSPPCEAADLIRKANAGVVVAPSDVEGIKNAINSLYESFLKGNFIYKTDMSVIEKYDRKLLTGKLAEVLDLSLRSVKDGEAISGS